MYDRRPGFFREDLPPGRRVEAKVKWFNARRSQRDNYDLKYFNLIDKIYPQW